MERVNEWQVYEKKFSHMTLKGITEELKCFNSNTGEKNSLNLLEMSAQTGPDLNKSSRFYIRIFSERGS